VDLRSAISRVVGPGEERSIRSLAGKVAEEACCDNDAQYFYRLSGDWTSLVELECSIASSALLRTPTPEESSEFVSQLIQTYDTIHQNGLETYNSITEGRIPVPPDRLEVLRLLLTLLWCVVLNESDDLNEAIAQMESLDLFPRSRSQILLYRERIWRLPEAVRTCLNSMAALLIRIYRRAYEEVKPSNEANESVDALITFLPDLDLLSEHMRTAAESASAFHMFAVDP
jgi:hypothetical protein